MSSKIKVDTIENVAGSGNVSLGSGHNLVVPGDLTVDTSTLKVDSSNNRVGIGTASPSQTLETAGNIFVNTSGNPNLTVKTTGAGNNPFVRIQADTNYWDLQSLFSNTNDELDFRYNGNSKMMIDSTGRVTKPNQPFFIAKPTASGDGQTRDPYKFENVIHNVGNHFVTSGTGAHERFVAPVTGRYMFTAMPGYLQASNNFAIRFLINGSIFAEPVRFIQGSAASHCAFTCSIIVQLSANDYVTLSSSGFTYHINTTYTFFSGILLS